nr:hypothetical protein [uncultured Acetatifactor sp.]
MIERIEKQGDCPKRRERSVWTYHDSEAEKGYEKAGQAREQRNGEAWQEV